MAIPRSTPFNPKDANSPLNSADVFSGADCKVLFMLPKDIPYVAPAFSKGLKDFQEMQTITVTSSSSLLPVRRVGELKPAAYGRGGRTFAGTIVFSVINQDPFQELFAFDNNSPATSQYSWHIDQMPPFDAIIFAQNEMGGAGIQVIHGIRLVNWGTTYSIDDMFIESTYTYVAEHVSPFAYDTFDANALYGVLSKVVPVTTVAGESAIIEEVAKLNNQWDSMFADALAWHDQNPNLAEAAGGSTVFTSDSNLGEGEGLHHSDDFILQNQIAQILALFDIGNQDYNYAIDFIPSNYWENFTV
jgi:hypothetical protein